MAAILAVKCVVDAIGNPEDTWQSLCQLTFRANRSPRGLAPGNGTLEFWFIVAWAIGGYCDDW